MASVEWTGREGEYEAQNYLFVRVWVNPVYRVAVKIHDRLRPESARAGFRRWCMKGRCEIVTVTQAQTSTQQEATTNRKRKVLRANEPPYFSQGL